MPDPDQLDADGDGVGDACQPGLDPDGDGVPNESDCAPADPGAWTSVDALAPIDVFVSKSPNGLLVRHGAFATSPGERPYAMDVAQGRLERLGANGSLRDARCVSREQPQPGEATLPWSELSGNRYVVVLPWNGCGAVDPSGAPDDPCR